MYCGRGQRSRLAGTEGLTISPKAPEFEAVWRDYLPQRTEADCEEWRDQEAWTAERYRRFDQHERMPPDWKRLARRAIG
jgi:hypothetical protein